MEPVQLNNIKCLLLNSDYTPIKILTWQKAFDLYFSDRAQLVDFWENHKIKDSAGRFWPIPCILRLRKFVPHKHLQVRLTKFHLLLRDKFTCQYCGVNLNKSNMTIDHVIPKRSWHNDIGIKYTSWQNVVLACESCNKKKGDKHVGQAGMKLLEIPKNPSYNQLLRGYISKYIGEVPKEWSVYIT